MKKFIACIVLICTFFLIATPVNSAIIIPTGNTTVPPDMVKKITTLKIKDIQKLSGRKLSLKEKIVFLVLKQKLKHNTSDKQNQGRTAFILGLVGLGLLIIGLFVPYVILGSIVSAILAIVLGSVAYKHDHSDKKAQAGKLLGWLTLGVTVLLLILAAIIIATWTSWI
ncbi:MAG TPA: hypothetical protein VET23_01430 [Chitinophagaceae bacterium]|nr:hypothetical protein [Chitinophagaceae bacterium]